MAQLNRLKTQLEIKSNEEDTLLMDLLESAKFAILSRRYPFGEFPVDTIGTPVLENRYLDLQVRIAVYLYNKMGAEGQIAHSENSISRTYESSDIPESLLRQVTPFVSSPIRLPIGEEMI
jgi:hypothetical protein